MSHYELSELSQEWQNVFWKGDLPDCPDGNCQYREYSLWLNTAGYLHFRSISVDGVGVGQTYTNTADGGIVAGLWYHFAAVVNATAGNLQIYLNGVLAAET